jgi:hypothetical protein
MALQTFEDDELTDIKAPATAATVATAAPTATSTSAATAPAQAKATATATDDFEDETSKPVVKTAAKTTKKEDSESGIHDTDFGDEKIHIRAGQLERVRPDKGKAKRFAFIPKSVVPMKSAKVHFVETGTGKEVKKGRYRCLGLIGDETQQFCCAKLEKDGEIHVAALVLEYTNADSTTGKYVKGADGTVPPIEWKLGFVDLSSFNMKQISKLPDEDQSAYDIDLIMTHAEGRAFGYEFSRASNKARWLNNAEVSKEVLAAAERFKDGKTLIEKLGKKITPLEWKVLLSGSGGEENKLENIDEL